MAQGEDCNQIIYIEYSYKQTGDTEEWLQKISAKINNPLTVRREILLQRLHGSSLSPFDREDIEYISETAQQPIDEMWLLDYYKFDIYTPLNRRTPYLIGVDCATGTNQDNNAITVLDPYTVKPVMEFECNYVGETIFERLLIELMKRLPRGVLCIERNSMGDGIIDHLLHSPIAPRLYFDKNKDLMSEKIRKDENIESILKQQVAQKKFYGVYTERDSRKTMMDILSNHVKEYKDDFITQNIIRDLTRLIRKPSGKIEAGDGFHDDSIMSYLITLYVYYHGNNLAAFGIKKGVKDLGPENEGMKHPDEIDPNLVDPKLINNVKERMVKDKVAKQELDWNSVMANAIKKAQQDTFERQQKRLLKDTIYEHTPSAVLEDFDDETSISMGFFDTMNGFNNDPYLGGQQNGFDQNPNDIYSYNGGGGYPPFW